MVEGIDHRSGAITQPELHEDPADVALDGQFGDEQGRCDLGVGEPASHRVQDLLLSAGQERLVRTLGRDVGGLAEAGEHALGHGRIEPRPALGHRTHGRDEILGGGVLEDEPVRAGAQRP